MNGGLAQVTKRTLPCIVERMKGEKTATSTKHGCDNSCLKFVLTEGRNRQIRKMTASLGMNVTRLHRVSFCGVSMAGIATPGSWTELTEEEEVAIGARPAPTRNDLRSPEEKAKRKWKKLAKKAKRTNP